MIKPAQPFLDWLHQVDSTSAHLTLEDLQREPTIYLVPECDTEDQAVEYFGGKRRNHFRGTPGRMVPRACRLAYEERSRDIPALV